MSSSSFSRPRSLPRFRATRILIVDDDATLARAYLRFLTRRGYRVFSDYTPQAALSRFRYKMIDMVISDFVMPQMNGEEFVARLRYLRPDLPVLMMSAHVDQVASNTKQHSLTRFLPKPVRKQELLDAVSSLAGPERRLAG